MSEFTGLAIAGRVATPADPDWDEARLAWNLAADQNPAAIAFAESAEDVAKALAFAAQNGLRVAGQGTGHGAAAMAPLDGALLIKTERMRGVEIDQGAQTARVQAGVLAMELGAAAADCLARAVARGVYEATALPYAKALPDWRSKFDRH